jgi:hypothetical protein
MSDALSDIARAEQDNLDYFYCINKLANYIAVRACQRPEQIRARYLLLAYTEMANQIALKAEELLESKGKKK